MRPTFHLFLRGTDVKTWLAARAGGQERVAGISVGREGDETVAYLAVREGSDVKGYVYVLVPSPAAPNLMGLKKLSESQVPAYTRCPKEILDLLTPPLDEYSWRWREMCEAHAGADPAVADAQ